MKEKRPPYGGHTQMKIERKTTKTSRCNNNYLERKHRKMQMKRSAYLMSLSAEVKKAIERISADCIGDMVKDMICKGSGVPGDGFIVQHTMVEDNDKMLVIVIAGNQENDDKIREYFKQYKMEKKEKEEGEKQ